MGWNYFSTHVSILGLQLMYVYTHILTLIYVSIVLGYNLMQDETIASSLSYLRQAKSYILGIPGACATRNFTYLVISPGNILKFTPMNKLKIQTYGFAYLITPRYWLIYGHWKWLFRKAWLSSAHTVHIMTNENFVTQLAKALAARGISGHSIDLHVDNIENSDSAQDGIS